MGIHSNEKQRLGVPSLPRSKSRKLLLIPACALAIYVLSFLFHPSTSPNHPLHETNLRPRNYLSTNVNQTLEELPNPFQFCPVGGPNDRLSEKYGATNLLRTRLHAGSGARVQRVLRRAMSGLPITISILGGSVSACHGAGDDPVSAKCWPAKFFAWWNEVFPHPATELTNGAMRKTDSSYYAFCHGHHVPDQTDLIILDFDSQDPNNMEYAIYFEMLIRSLLLRQDHPAVIVLGHYSPQTQEVHTFMGPDTIHTLVSQFYDVPHISMKPLLYAPYVVAPDSVKALFVDAHLSSPAGHTLLAELLEAYFQHQICQAWLTITAPETHTHHLEPLANVAGGGVLGMRKDQGTGQLGVGLTGGGTPNKVPNFASVGYMLDARPAPFILKTRPNDLHDFREPKPFCVSANDLINPLPPSLFTETGWHVQHPQGSHVNGHKGVENAHYWYSRLPGSRLKVPIKLGSGDVAIYYMKEPFSKEDENSEVDCWVDDNYGGAVRIQGGADVGQPIPALKIIDRSVAKGSHTVECVLVGDEGSSVMPFRILGIFGT